MRKNDILNVVFPQRTVVDIAGERMAVVRIDAYGGKTVNTRGKQ